MTRTDAELGWIAGFFDGEGHVSYNRSRPNPKTGRVSPSIQCNVSQIAENIEVLEKFQRIVGFGHISTKPYKTPKGKDKLYVSFKKYEVRPLFELLMPNLGTEKIGDFTRALEQYANHDGTYTEADAKRIARIGNKGRGCKKCGEDTFNGIMCTSCGYPLITINQHSK